MRTVVKKWRNSASVRIPASVMQAAHLELDETVDVPEESGRIVIEPAQRKNMTWCKGGLLPTTCTTRWISDELWAKRHCSGAVLRARRRGHRVAQLRSTDWTRAGRAPARSCSQSIRLQR